MAIQLKNGAVFLHVPKTGGSWVTEVLRSNGLVQREFSHIHADMVRVLYYKSGGQAFWRSSYERLKSWLPHSLKASIMTSNRRHQIARRQNESRPFTFCFVRHPLRWYESWWRYMNGRSGSNWAQESDLLGWHPCAAIKDCGDRSYEQFVRNVAERRPGFVSELFATYAQPNIDFVGKQENLTEDFIKVLKRQGVDFDEKKIREQAPVNVSPLADAKLKLPEDLTVEIERLEIVALRRFGYSTDSQ